MTAAFWEPGAVSLSDRFQEKAAHIVEQIDSHNGGSTTWHLLTLVEKRHVVSMYVIAHDDTFGIRDFIMCAKD